MSTHAIHPIVQEARAKMFDAFRYARTRNRIWVEENGTEVMLCKFCGEWQKCFEGAACPTCVDCAKAEGEQLN